jgi:hypothetical protein
VQDLLSSHLVIIVLTLNQVLWLKFLSFTGSPIHHPSRCSQRCKRDSSSLEGFLASFHVRLSRSLATEAGGRARVCTDLVGCTHGRMEVVLVDLVGKVTTATDPAMKTAIRPKGRWIKPERSWQRWIGSGKPRQRQM